MFIDREEELRFLEELWGRGGPQLVVIYGRRRVGKTWLVKKFLEGRPGLYFYALRQPLKIELERFAESVGRSLRRYVKADWDAVFEALAEGGRLAVAIDEFTHWVEADSSAMSILQRAWDEYLSKSEAFLILLSSTVSLVEASLSYGGGLFGRRTAQLKVDVLAPHYAKYFLPYGAEELAVAYAVSNGVPHYLSLFRREKPLWENLQYLFSKWGPLHEEAENLLRYEVREPHVYLNIVRAIEEGATTYSEIADKSKIPSPTLAKYLHVLERLDVVKREQPVLAKGRPIYVVKDLYVKFWVRHVYRHREAAELGELPPPDVDKYMAQAYEEIVRRALPRLRQRGILPHLGRCGKYWHRDVEVDIVCVEGDKVAAVEVKWADVDSREAEELARETRRKLGRDGTYVVAARRLKDRGGPAIDASDIFEVWTNNI